VFLQDALIIQAEVWLHPTELCKYIEERTFSEPETLLFDGSTHANLLAKSYYWSFACCTHCWIYIYITSLSFCSRRWGIISCQMAMFFFSFCEFFSFQHVNKSAQALGLNLSIIWLNFSKLRRGWARLGLLLQRTYVWLIVWAGTKPEKNLGGAKQKCYSDLALL